MDPEKINKTSEGIEAFIDKIVDAWRTRNWYRLLIVLLAVAIAVGLVIPSSWRPFWIISVLSLVGVVLLIALLRPRQVLLSLSPVNDSAIKGLRPFGFRDADAFSRLQRHEALQECYSNLTDTSFRFGILCSESGCGKTSFLQAGLWPKLKGDDKALQRCVYVKFTDLDPLESIRLALIEQLSETHTQTEATDFPSLLDQLLQANPKPIVFLFDQFEQYFLHTKQELSTDSFAQGLATWYQQRSRLGVRILVSLREDFLGRMVPLQKVMGYSLGPQDLVRLEKFTPHQAAKIFEVIAGFAKMPFDEGFVKNMAARELASRDDGLISPVDIQILAWMLAGQQNAEAKDFTEQSFKRLGGVEGLLERFLARSLEARVTPAGREAAVKVLLALTDLEHNVRAGMLTKANLQERLNGSLMEGELQETLEWLVGSDVRLVTPDERRDPVAYELVHERLILALRKTAKRFLTGAEEATQLLDRRVNEWLGNNRSARFLLSWKEWRLVERYYPQLIWGPQHDAKQSLLSLTRRRWYWYFSIASGFILFLFVGLGWSQTPQGQVWQARREFFQLGADPNRIDNRSNLSLVVQAYLLDKEVIEATQYANQVNNTRERVDLLLLIADSCSKTGDSTQAVGLLRQAKQQIATLRPIPQGDALPALAAASAELKDPVEAINLLKEVQQQMDSTNAYSKALALPALAAAYAKLKDTSRAVALLQQAQQQITVLTLDDQATVLTEMAVISTKLKDTTLMAALLQRAQRQIVMLEPSSQPQQLIPLAAAYAELKDSAQATTLWRQVQRQTAMLRPYYQAKVLAALAAAYAKLKDPAQAITLLRQVQRQTAMLDPVYQPEVLAALAAAYAKLKDPAQAITLLRQAQRQIATLDPSSKTEVLSDMASTYAKCGEWKLTKQLTAQLPKSQVMKPLYAILQEWHDHPKKH